MSLMAQVYKSLQKRMKNTMANLKMVSETEEEFINTKNLSMMASGKVEGETVRVS